MNHFFAPILVTHVLTAVLGLGLITSVAVSTGNARRSGLGSPEIFASLRPLLRYSVISLAAMLITGILLDLAAGGAFRKAWWFRVSALLLFVTGALHGQARRSIRPEVAKERGTTALRRVELIAYGMCALVAAITILMEVKPF